MSTPSGTPDTPPAGTPDEVLLTARAARFAEVALANITREYPNAPAHLLAGPHELVPPRTLHPAFYGAYDWHSSVHMHWLLLRLLRLPWDDGGEPERTAALREEAVRTLDAHLTAASLDAEAAYLRAHPWFERPYGWAWLLALTAESAAPGDEGGRDAPCRTASATRPGAGTRHSPPPPPPSRTCCSPGCRRPPTRSGTAPTPTAPSPSAWSWTAPNAPGSRSW